MNSTEQNYRDNESGGDYPYYLDMGGDLSRDEWEAAGYPETPGDHAIRAQCRCGWVGGTRESAADANDDGMAHFHSFNPLNPARVNG